MKAGADLEQTCHSTLNTYSAFRWLSNPAQDLEQRRFPGSVPANDADDVTLADFKIDIPKRPQFFKAVSLNDGVPPHEVLRLVPHAVHVVHEHIAQGDVTAILGLMTDHIFLAEVLGFNNHVAHLNKVGKCSFHFAEPGNTSPKEAGDDGRAECKARPVNGTCASKNAPTETVDDADERIQTVKQPPLFGDHATAETDGRNV